jgi:hypothetical protein
LQRKARYKGRCRKCEIRIKPGDTIHHVPAAKKGKRGKTFCRTCVAKVLSERFPPGAGRQDERLATGSGVRDGRARARADGSMTAGKVRRMSKVEFARDGRDPEAALPRGGPALPARRSGAGPRCSWRRWSGEDSARTAFSRRLNSRSRSTRGRPSEPGAGLPDARGARSRDRAPLRRAKRGEGADGADRPEARPVVRHRRPPEAAPRAPSGRSG